ncbi:Pre-mRNA-processing factor 39 [Candida viswanathii]|uniref:Pre-mRNA-processing factor 39 n=1 Tax=Candida viswanathii TaxID=5486 RepID=A0A367XMM6_9ASCO|nr:Pre-mRNA-processing factor 39 [Candida viswanathii]
MSLLHLPQDLEDRATSTPHLSSSPIATLRNEISQDINNIDKWNQLFKHFKQHIDQVGGPSQLDDDFKKLVHESYKTLLSRFLYLETIWQDWADVEKDINGKKAYLDVLRMGVESYPHSVQLWADYLKSVQEEEENIELFRGLYRQALKYNEYDFMSNLIWDIAIEFETRLKDDSNELGELYMRVLRIPLYHYAQYYNQFNEISKKFDIELIVPQQDLVKYANEFGHGDKVGEISLIEKYQVIDDYVSNIFNTTQAKVNSQWGHESSLEWFKFDMKKLNEIKKEKETWVKYVDEEIKEYEADPNPALFKLVCNLFERALVPNCYDTELWLKYIGFIDNLKDENKSETIKAIYLRINAKLIPLDDTTTRFKYVELLVAEEEYSQAVEYLFNWVKVYAGGASKKYYKLPYLKTVKEMIKLWEELVNKSKLITIYESIINSFFSIHEKSQKKNDKEEEPQPKDKLEILDSLISLLSNFLNDESICIVVVSYLTLLSTLNEVIKIRQFFNKFHTYAPFKKSVQFWTFFFRFESPAQQGNLANLKLIIDYIKYLTQLPKLVIDVFIEMNYEICADNIKEYLKLNNGRSDETLIIKDLETCNSVVYNRTTIKRQARNNYIIANSNVNSKLKKKAGTNEEEFLSLVSKQIGHPGVFVDAIPQITNKVMGNDIDLSQSDVAIPPLPVFKNVEKASLPIKYPK